MTKGTVTVSVRMRKQLKKSNGKDLYNFCIVNVILYITSLNILLVIHDLADHESLLRHNVAALKAQ